ncbi:hypothetical protein, partial [Actinoalloteichus spitiensis]|uniref:hypothetical protein n=1 Tax=Actinoalloteichus spitiensis TaxID=252394 RepID=UPI001B7FDA10
GGGDTARVVPPARTAPAEAGARSTGVVERDDDFPADFLDRVPVTPGNHHETITRSGVVFSAVFATGRWSVEPMFSEAALA